MKTVANEFFNVVKGGFCIYHVCWKRLSLRLLKEDQEQGRRLFKNFLCGCVWLAAGQLYALADRHPIRFEACRATKYKIRLLTCMPRND